MATSPTASETAGRQSSTFPDFGARLAASRIDPRACDQLLCELLVAYRSTRARSQIAPLILEAVRPHLEVRRLRLRPQEPSIDAEDVSQQLLLEILDLALWLPLHHGAFLERRLLLRAIERVTRRLKREVRFRSLISHYPEEPDVEPAP